MHNEQTRIREIDFQWRLVWKSLIINSCKLKLKVLNFAFQNICRSATLSGGPEIYGRSGYDFLFAGKNVFGNKYCDWDLVMSFP